MKTVRSTSLNALTAGLRSVRSHQPRVTLQQAQAQAVRVMEAAKRSPLRSKPCLNGEKRTDSYIQSQLSHSFNGLLTRMATSTSRGLTNLLIVGKKLPTLIVSV